MDHHCDWRYINRHIERAVCYCDERELLADRHGYNGGSTVGQDLWRRWNWAATRRSRRLRKAAAGKPAVELLALDVVQYRPGKSRASAAV